MNIPWSLPSRLPSLFKSAGPQVTDEVTVTGSEEPVTFGSFTAGNGNGIGAGFFWSVGAKDGGPTFGVSPRPQVKCFICSMLSKPKTPVDSTPIDFWKDLTA